MRTSIAKWGNSLAVRVPREAAAAAGLREGATLELTLEDNAIVLRRRAVDIRDLVAAIDGPPPPLELEDDAPRGSEAW
jgi:antitoxin MazE